MERERIPERAIRAGTRCNLADMSLRNSNKVSNNLRVDRSQVATHDRVHKAGLQPISTVAADQLAVDEKAIRLHGQDPWLYGAVDPERTKSCT